MKSFAVIALFLSGAALGAVSAVLGSWSQTDRAIAQSKEAIEVAGYWRGEAVQWKAVTDRCVKSLENLAAAKTEAR